MSEKAAAEEEPVVQLKQENIKRIKKEQPKKPAAPHSQKVVVGAPAKQRATSSKAVPKQAESAKSQDTKKPVAKPALANKAVGKKK